ncbi:hypothetical protein ACFLV1_02625, partial [Chloroflexota bacterium]
DTDGNFVFEGLKTEPGYEYRVSLFFQKAEYTNDWLTFEAGEENKAITITVYDATTSSEAIRIPSAHTIVYVSQGALELKEYYLFINDSDHTYIGPTNDPGNNGVLSFPLPQEATDFVPSMGLTECCTSIGDGGFTDGMPVAPGFREIAFSYHVPYQSGEYLLNYQTNYPIDNYDLLVQGNNVRVSSTQLTEGEALEISGNTYQHFSRQGFLPDDTLVINLTSLSDTGSESTFPWLVLVLMIVILTGGAGYLLLKKRAPPTRVAGVAEGNQQELLQEIARLDDEFENGAIGEEDYRTTREKKKQQLVNLMGRGSKESG